MKYFKIILFLWVLAWLLTSFFHINALNYGKHLEIRNNYVNHPEGLPAPQVAKYTSFGFANLRADLYWLQTIQYIGWNALSSEYKKYLFNITDLITELNPYFEHPYIIAQLLLPSVNQRYEDINDQAANKNTDDAINIWLKGVENFCDSDIVDQVNWESNLNKIKDMNPCKSYKVPYYLALVYFHYKNDPLSASKYYKIASANSDSVSWASSMAAIMAWKSWNREKSIFMFLNIAESLDTKNWVCSEFSKELQDVSKLVFQEKKIPLSWNLIRTIENSRVNTFWLFDSDNTGEYISDTSCITFLNKANREINIAYLDQANENYQKDNNNENAKDWQELLDKGYINFLPTDFQQYKEENYWIKYLYNKELDRFDYKMYY